MMKERHFIDGRNYLDKGLYDKIGYNYTG